VLAEQVEQCRLDGGYGMNGDAQVEGLQAAAGDIAVGEGLARLVQQRVEIADRLPDEDGTCVFEGLANGFATGDFANSGVAGAVLENEDVAGEIRTMGAAQVEQHAVLTGNRDHLEFGDDRGAVVCRVIHRRLSIVLMVRVAVCQCAMGRHPPSRRRTRTGGVA